MRFFLILIISIISHTVSAQTIRGTIQNTEGESLEFVNIYIEDLDCGSVSNIKGEYTIEVPAGEHIIHFSSVSYHSLSVKTKHIHKDTTINIKLVNNNYHIPEIKILASGDDPSYYIIRKAIAMQYYYENVVNKYTCMVNIKGLTKILEIPYLLKSKLSSLHIFENEQYLSETTNKITFTNSDITYKQLNTPRSDIIGSNTDPMPLITTKLYDTREHGLISPLDRKAFSVYKYQLISVYKEGDNTINKIKIIPKRYGKDLFRGYINIIDDSWAIHSANLRFSMSMCTIHMVQKYSSIKNDIWMPTNLHFDINFEGIGIRAKIKYLAYISKYNIEINNNLILHKGKPSVTKNCNTQEIYKILNKPNIKASEMRKLSRYIKKEEKYQEKLKEKRSIINIKNIPIIRDYRTNQKISTVELSEDETTNIKTKSTNNIIISKKPFKIKDIFSGGTYNLFKGKIHTPGILESESIRYNTVDGFVLSAPFRYAKKDSMAHYMHIAPEIEYCVARKKINSTLEIQYRYKGINRSWLGLAIANKTRDFNYYEGIHNIENTIYSLLFTKNHLKLHKEVYFRSLHSIDICNSLRLTSRLNYIKNYQVYNNSNFGLRKQNNKKYTKNIINNIDHLAFKNNVAFTLENTLSYTPFQRYVIKNGLKVMRKENKYPTIELNYKQAFKNILSSDSKYSLVEITIKHKTNIGLMKSISYKLNTGRYYSANKIHLSQYKHFNTSIPVLSFNTYKRRFRLLPYYKYSCNSTFAQAHIMFSSERLLLKKLPILNNSALIEEQLFFNYLYTKGRKAYYEFGYQLSNIFLFINLELCSSFEGNKYKQSAIKININL